jgi:hypothetical protein
MTYADNFNLRATNLNFNNVADAIDGVMSRNNGGTTTGSSTAYAATCTPAWTAYEQGRIIAVVPHTDNTGSSTLNVNSLGTRTIKYKNQNLVGGELKNGVTAFFVVTASDFELLNHGGGWATWTPTGGGAYPTTVTVISCVYQRHGNRVDFIAVTDATTTSANQAITLTLPVTASTGHVGLGTSGNNGNNIPTFGFFLSTTVMQIQRADLVNWASGVSTRVRAAGSYAV